MGTLYVLSGPSCVGKSPLKEALTRLRPDVQQNLTELVLYNDRPPRPGEVDGADYHFRSTDEIRALASHDGVEVMKVRGDTQAIDFQHLGESLATRNVLFEGNPFVGERLLDWTLPDGAARVSLFLAPLSRAEIEYLLQPNRHVDLPRLVTDLMRRKLLRRTCRQKGILSGPDLENVETRAASAYREMTLAWRFDHVLANHDGEDSENWDAFYYPVGDAWLCLQDFIALLTGEKPRRTERWSSDLLPPLDAGAQGR